MKRERAVAARVEGIAPFAVALGLGLVLELGDKTQLATISLATRHPRLPVFAGACLGLVAVTAVGAAVGAALVVSLEAWLPAIKVGGGALFIALGAWTYVRKEEKKVAEDRRGAFATALALNLVAELGDKSQLAVIVLAATYAAPLSVFAGASLALALIAAMSVLVGAALVRVLSAEWLRRVSTALFIAAGVLLILEAVLGG